MHGVKATIKISSQSYSECATYVGNNNETLLIAPFGRLRNFSLPKTTTRKYGKAQKKTNYMPN